MRVYWQQTERSRQQYLSKVQGELQAREWRALRLVQGKKGQEQKGANHVNINLGLGT